MKPDESGVPGRPSTGGAHVSQQYQTLYDDYYTNTNVKREITAEQTFGHIRSVWCGGQVNRMLDVGAGEGSLLTHLAKSGLAGELYAVEISDGGVDAIVARNVPSLVEIKKFDGYHIPYPDQHFDVACSTHVLEHERSFLTEMCRVAKRLIIEVPLEQTISVKRAIQLSRPYGHINLYTPTTFRNLLETTGLDVYSLNVFGSSLAPERCVYGSASGTMRYVIRTGLLRLAPALATSCMTYVCMAVCSPRR